MGGGGAMRAAAKVAGVGVVNCGLRGFPGAAPPAEQSVRNVSLPVSAMISSSQQGGKVAADVAAVQRPAWEIDDWEFAGGEEELVLSAGEPMPRVVFGGAPSLQEAKAATTELKDAIDKVYLSSSNSLGFAGSVAGLSVLPNSEYLETKPCVTSQTITTPPVPKHALQAFNLLNESVAAQNVVASLVSDPKVWNAVSENEEVVKFLMSHKAYNGASFPDMNFNIKASVADTDSQDQESPKKFDAVPDETQSESSGTGFMEVIENIKLTVVDMVSSVRGFLHSIFGGSTADKKDADADENTRSTFMDRTPLASFMGLAVLVFMVVVLKRG